MARLHRMVIAVAALVATTCACGRTSEPGPAPGSVAASATASSVTAVDPQAKKSVAPGDCEAWAAHGVDAFLASIKVAVAGCPPPAGDAVVKTFVGQIVTIRGAAESTCRAHLGETYSVGDAACYTKATDALTLRACKFAPMTNPSDDDWGASLKSMHDHCAIVAPGNGAAPPPAGPKGSTPI